MRIVQCFFVYIHGWQNNANSGDVCRFEHFIDTLCVIRKSKSERLM
jgi:hypothetical protein